MTAVARVLVLSEDGSSGAVSVVQKIVRHMLQQLEPAADVARFTLDPLPESRAREAIVGNVWKSAKKTANARVVDLVQHIARQLVSQDGFVVAHIDGDCTWAERGDEENLTKWKAVVERRVREQVRVWAAKKGRGAATTETMSRLLVLAPFWSIEAWLFQSDIEARRHCRGTDHECDRRLDAWRADRSLLDEERKPKELLCFGSRHNEALAATFPANDVRLAGKSYAAAVAVFAKCEPLVAALGRAIGSAPTA